MATTSPQPTKVTNIAEKQGPDWGKLRAMYDGGAGDPEIARELNIPMKKFHQLYEEVQAFADFVDMGRTLSMAWWYEKGRTGLFAEKFNSPLFGFNMKNRFGWADKVDTTSSTTDGPVDADKIKGQLAIAIKKLAKIYPELVTADKLDK